MSLKRKPQESSGKSGSCFLSELCATLARGWCNTHMYSMVPQKVCVTEPSWIDSLQRPKSVSLMCPSETAKRSLRWQYFLYTITNTFWCLKAKLHLSHKSWKNNTWVILNTVAVYNFSYIKFERKNESWCSNGPPSLGSVWITDFPHFLLCKHGERRLNSQSWIGITIWKHCCDCQR